MMSVAKDSFVRAIALFDLDAFFVSVERKLNPELEEQPLIVGGKGNRAVVAACSYETRKYGVHSAMPMVQALRLCPNALVVSPNRPQYIVHSRMVTEIIAQQIPLFEKASIDEFYVDFSGLGDFAECYVIATELREKIIEETQLVISFALSKNKLVSKIAVDTVKPNGQILVEPGTEAAFLAPMKIEKIPMVGKETAARLHKLGIFTIDQLAHSSKDTLRTFFGKHGEILIDRAKGIDNSPVKDDRKHKSISTETTFDEDLSEVRALKEAFSKLNKKNAYQLRKSGTFTSCVAIKMRFNDFQTISRQMTIDPTTSEKKLEKRVFRLFQQYYVESSYNGKKVRLIGVRYSGLVNEGFQLDLFETNTKEAGLEATIRRLKEKYGEGYIFRAGDL